MESIKLSHVLLVLAAIPVIVAGIICLIVGTLLMTDWTTQIIGENLSYFSDILGLFSNILGVLIDIGGAIVLAQGCAVIILRRQKNTSGTQRIRLSVIGHTSPLRLLFCCLQQCSMYFIGCRLPLCFPFSVPYTSSTLFLQQSTPA